MSRLTPHAPSAAPKVPAVGTQEAPRKLQDAIQDLKDAAAALSGHRSAIAEAMPRALTMTRKEHGEIEATTRKAELANKKVEAAIRKIKALQKASAGGAS